MKKATLELRDDHTGVTLRFRHEAGGFPDAFVEVESRDGDQLAVLTLGSGELLSIAEAMYAMRDR